MMLSSKTAKKRTPMLIKWHGGKYYLAKQIVALMPRHLHYVEPYFGGGSVLLAKNPEGVSEVVNDLNDGLVCLWRVVRNRRQCKELHRLLRLTPVSESEWERAYWRLRNGNGNGNGEGMEAIETARDFYIVCRQSLGGRMKEFHPPVKKRTYKGMQGKTSAWIGAIEHIEEIHNRLRRVIILCQDALKVIQQQDGPRMLFYCDPPYLKKSRASPDMYAHEMTMQQHAELLVRLGHIRGKFLLSGYRSSLYDYEAARQGWYRAEFEVSISAAGKTKTGLRRRAIECLWMNYRPPTVNGVEIVRCQ